MFLAAAWLLLPVRPGAGQAAPQDELQSAIAAERSGHPEEAAAHYEKFLAALPASASPSPSQIQARTRLATAYFLLHRYQDSLHALEPLLPAMSHMPSEEARTPTAPPSEAAVPAQAWLVRGLDLLELNDLPAAQASFRRALALNPESGTARLGLGDAMVREGRLEEAAGEYREQLRRTPQVADAWYKLGLVYMQMGQKLSNDLGKQPAQNAVTCQLAAEQLLERGDHWGAARILFPMIHRGEASRIDVPEQGVEAIASREPACASADLPGLHADLGTALLELDYPRAAEKEFHAELARDPDSLPALVGLAQVEALASKWNHVAMLFERLSRDYPRGFARRLQFPPAGAVRYALEKGSLSIPASLNVSAAVRLLNEWLSGTVTPARDVVGDPQPCPVPVAKIDPRPGYWVSETCYKTFRDHLSALKNADSAQDVKLIEAEYRLGDFEAAARRAKSHCAAAPDDPWGVYWLLNSYLALADQCLDKLSALNPDSPRVHETLAHYYAERHDRSRARREFEKAIQLAPNLPDLYLGLGTLYWQERNWAAAEAPLRKAVQLAPSSVVAAYYLGDTYVQLRRWELAIAQLRRAVGDATIGRSARLDLAKAEVELGQDAAAIQDLLALDQDDPDGQAHYRLGLLYRKQGDPTRAQKAFAASEALHQAYAQADQEKRDSLDNVRAGIEKLEQANPK